MQQPATFVHGMPSPGQPCYKNHTVASLVGLFFTLVGLGLISAWYKFYPNDVVGQDTFLGIEDGALPLPDEYGNYFFQDNEGKQYLRDAIGEPIPTEEWYTGDMVRSGAEWCFTIGTGAFVFSALKKYFRERDHYKYYKLAARIVIALMILAWGCKMVHDGVALGKTDLMNMGLGLIALAFISEGIDLWTFYKPHSPSALTEFQAGGEPQATPEDEHLDRQALLPVPPAPPPAAAASSQFPPAAPRLPSGSRGTRPGSP